MKSVKRRVVPFVLLVGVALAGAFGVGVSQAQEKRKSIVGTWKIKGWNAGREKVGKPNYVGTVEVEKKNAKGCYKLTWRIGKSVQSGVAVYDRKSGVLGAAYVLNGKPGVVLYRPDDTGDKLEGLWTLKGALDRPPGFEQWRR
ncbi:MAG: hypothetical protein JKY65_01670 [Planctomycetes bacterium]|nr:hypothetical protein [Planctomycetota bacterium]